MIIVIFKKFKVSDDMYKAPKVIDKVITENGEIQLQKRNGHFEIIFNGVFLMATYNEGSAKLLVSSAIESISLPKKVLIGGLGVGFSLSKALEYEKVEEVTVVEIEPNIIEWNRKYLAEFSGNALEDPRVEVINTDFIKWMANTTNKYDVICLDIDNGPDWTVLDDNESLYSCEGLQTLKKLLNPGGAISFWSASKSDVFKERLKKFFKRVSVYPVSHESGEPDYVYLGNIENIS